MTDYQCQMRRKISSVWKIFSPLPFLLFLGAPSPSCGIFLSSPLLAISGRFQPPSLQKKGGCTLCLYQANDFSRFTVLKVLSGTTRTEYNTGNVVNKHNGIDIETERLRL